MPVPILPLTEASFRPYGDVIDAQGERMRLVNEGRADRFDAVAALAHRAGTAMPVLATYRVRPSRPPFAIDLFERHPFSSQMFLPIRAGRFLVGVAPDAGDGRPDAELARIFVASGVGIHYRAGVWHVPMMVLDREAVFAMVMWEQGRDDTQEYRLPAPLRASLDPPPVASAMPMDSERNSR